MKRQYLKSLEALATDSAAKNGAQHADQDVELALHQWQRVQDYLPGRMNSAALADFIEDLAQDSELKALLEYETDLTSTIKQVCAKDSQTANNFAALLQRIDMPAPPIPSAAPNSEARPRPMSLFMSGAQDANLEQEFATGPSERTGWQLIRQRSFAVLTQPISTGVSMLAISATIGVSIADELHEPIYRTLSDSQSRAALDWETSVQAGQIIRITFAADITPSTISEFLATEQFKILVGANADNQILIAAKGPLSATSLAAFETNPIVEFLVRIDSTAW